MTAPTIMAAIEGGGTSFRVAVCELTRDGSPRIVHRTEIDSTGDPHATLRACAAFLTLHQPRGGYHSLGIATFGPVGVNPQFPDNYGRILSSSPKAAWRNVDLLTPLRRACEGNARSLQVLVETDVNAPALAEYRDAAEPISSVAYVTVGTGVGVGLVVNHQPVHGFLHPEGGHVPVQPLLNDAFGGYSWGQDASPFFGRNTVEGLASSVALTERLELLRGSSIVNRNVLSTLPDDHEIWEHAANALANLCVTLLLTLSVEKIVLGGGVMNRPRLLQMIQTRTDYLLNGYLKLPRPVSRMIVKSRLGNDIGLIGAMVLAQRALEDDGDNDQKRSRAIKAEAYGYGLRHGMMLGALAAALFTKYVWLRPAKK